MLIELHSSSSWTRQKSNEKRTQKTYFAKIWHMKLKGAINRTFRTKCLCYAFPSVSGWFSVLISYQDMYPIYINNYFMIGNSVHNHFHVFEMLKRRAFRRNPDKKWRLLILKQKIDMGTIWCHLWLCTSKMFCSICVMLIRIKGNVQCLLENTNKKKNSVVRVLAMSLLCWFRYFIVIFMHYHDKTETNAT